MKIREVIKSDFAEWLRLRKSLYSKHDLNELKAEMEAIYFDKNVVGELDYFVCAVENTESELCGFCETSLRKTDPYFKRGPVGFVESLFIESDFRMKGLAKRMLAESEEWVRANKCLEFWVDTEERNWEAICCYERFGFREVERKNSEILLMKKLI